MPQGTTEALYACGGIERPWTTGDNVSLAVGQGDLQATPLQLAEAYSTIINGGKVVRPHLGLQVEDGQGRLVEEIRTPIRRRVQMDPAYREAIMAGLHGAATAQGGTSADVFAGSPYRDNLYGKTGTAERQPNPDQSWYACYVDDPLKPIVVVTTIERGGFGAETAAPAARLILNEWFDVRDPSSTRGRPVELSSHPIQPASEPPPPLVPREWRLRLDPLLLVATLGLVACSLIALNGATQNDIAGKPDYYVIRQAIYAGIGLVLMYALSRLDYSRLRELRYPIYGVMIGLLVFVLGIAQATRGAKSWIALPGFNFQPSELGKVLLVAALGGFVVDRMRRMGRDTTARIMLLGLIPTMLVIAEPDLGSALVYVAATLAILFVAGAPWRHFAALGALFAVADHDRARRGAEGRASRCSSPTRSTA